MKERNAQRYETAAGDMSGFDDVLMMR